MIFPADDQSLNEPLKRAMAAGIPVIVVNHDVNDPTARYGFVGPDNFQVGVMGGRYAVKYLNGKGKVAFMTTTNPAHGLRTAGYKDSLQGLSGHRGRRRSRREIRSGLRPDRCHAVDPGAIRTWT